MPRQLPAALPLEATWAREEKPLPQLPSPTLTNPDYILPDSMPNVSSPPRVTRRPPSPSYLRDSSEESPRMGPMGKKEKLGLMSRKMMLLRSRTASGGPDAVPAMSRASPAPGSTGNGDFIPSSPILQDVGNLAPEQAPFLQLPELDRRSTSGGSSSSDMSGMAAFLAKYEKKDASSDDETLLHENGEAPAAYADEDNNTEADSELSEERKKQQQDEYQSAILSKRAEQILANAKKRLNVMEGNLRGARDLVAPLTAANLKRATSLGSAQYIPGHGGRRYVTNEYDYEDGQQPERTLQTQASSPTMGRDYYSHARGFSETELPERSHTALDHTYDAYHTMSGNVRTAPQRSFETSNQGLRSTRSYDVLGGYGLGRERPLHSRASPDSGASSYLEPLQEADETRGAVRQNGAEGYNHGLGIYRPSSRTSDLREQMSSLKGKISNLKERAREESLRRQSQSNLRNASPFNNAASTAPEMYYTSSSGYSSPILDTNAGAGRTSTSNSPASAHFPNTVYDSRAPVSGSRNAFAEQAAAQKQNGSQQAQVAKAVTSRPTSRYQVRQESRTESPNIHRRTPSGTAIVQSAKNRYSHHQQQSTQEMPGAFIDEDEAYLEVPSPRLPKNHQGSSSSSSGGSSRASPHIDDDGAPSEDGASVYEDAENDQDRNQSPVVAHEDRADAFDYENFFLHSAMGRYSNGRRGSDSSDASVSSVETAKGPAFNGNEDEDYDDRTAEFPSTPETPEKLREIEANLHKRSFSEESVSTMATYATADEDFSSPERRLSPPVLSPTGRSFSQSIPRPVSRPGSRPQSRPSTAVNRALPSDNSSDRADSGVGLPRRSIPPPGSMTPKARKAGSSASNVITPPLSPRGAARLDPAAVAVNALLDPNGRSLGLRNKAVLFSVVESLRKVVSQLQELDETSYDSRELRGRLDEAKYMLDGRGEH